VSEWGTFPQAGYIGIAVIHVIPMRDLRDHLQGSDCWCNPKPSPNESRIVVHNALDGREKYETGERQLT
jgi:hypothetical protein